MPIEVETNSKCKDIKMLSRYKWFYQIKIGINPL